MGKLKVDCLMVGMVGTNCYLAANTDTGEALIIDPGDEAGRISERIEKRGLKPVAILLTHGHFDHVMAAAELSQQYQIDVYIYRDEIATIQDPALNACGMIGRHETYEATKTVQDEEVLTLAGFQIRVLFTPGHTPGGCCYYFEEEGALFSGDTLFAQSVGRTDFPKGSMSNLVRSIKEKLMVLPDDTAVFPGHEGTTTIGTERVYNPYVSL